MPMSAPQRRRSEAAKPPARLRKAERKRQLLGHAKQLFVTLGYQATTTEKIAAAAGVSEPVLYRHFENKKALFLEVLREIRAATLQRFREGLISASQKESGQTLLTLFHLTGFEPIPNDFNRVLAETREAYPPPAAK